MKYCPFCGSKYPSQSAEFEGYLCGDCGKIFYLQLKLGAGALIETDGKLLLLKRGYEPFMGSWNLPAGYVNADENPREAVKREVMEECGLEVEVGKLVDAYYFDDDPRGDGVMLIYRCTALSDDLVLDEEASEAEYFSSDSLPENLAFAGHNQAILTWKSCA